MKIGRRQKRQKGQMAIFVALIFQMLFIFFAMIINVGMIVYHKINLQNAVDFAAYYAAERQAEILNVIAHQNYQMRQSYKLLAWRYRVIGSMGREYVGAAYDPSPTLDSSVAAETQEPDAPYLGPGTAPYICVGNNGWQSTNKMDDLCKGKAQIPIHIVPPVTIDLFGFNAPIQNYFRVSQQDLIHKCDQLGPSNWLYAALIFYSYKMDQADRKNWINQLAQYLSQSTTNFADVSGDSVRAGMLKTLEKNLDSPNLAGLDPNNVKFFNSLGVTRDRHKWLADIPIDPVLLWENTTPGLSCQINIEQMPPAGTQQPPTGRILKYYNWAGWLINAVGGEPPATDPMHSSLGFEKNPWYMAYVGVEATTKVKGIFAPFGGTITLTARSFAKPFGGRIGPWYENSWPRGASESTGQLVDALVAPRADEANALAQQNTPSAMERFFPNYSRYPGDKLGLNSRLALTTLPPYGPQRQAISLNFFSNLVQNINKNASGDPLTWNSKGQQTWVRDYEIAAVSPDLFDAIYYSIDPNYSYTYLPELNRRQASEQLPHRLRPDLGARLNDSQLAKFDVEDQIKTVTSNPQTASLQDPHYFWLIRSINHLLTGWVFEKLNELMQDPSQFPTKFYANCLQEAGPRAPIPGKCAAGGRVGYSVKFVSRDYLVSKHLQLGGPAGGEGEILNPPPF